MSHSNQSKSADAGARAKNSFGQTKPRRRMSVKVAAMSPEAQRLLEERNRSLIDDALAKGLVTKCPVRWAVGAVAGGPFGSQES
jgi:hypothetical protein